VDVSSSQTTGYLAGEATVRPQLVRLRVTPGEWNARTSGIRTCLAHCSVLRVRALGAAPRERRSDLENSITSASIYYSQVTKGLRWMPWRQEPMKDARDCEKLRGAVNEALIRRYPNGETRPGSCPVTQV
jgi:hypothetical protein